MVKVNNVLYSDPLKELELIVNDSLKELWKFQMSKIKLITYQSLWNILTAVLREIIAINVYIKNRANTGQQSHCEPHGFKKKSRKEIKFKIRIKRRYNNETDMNKMESSSKNDK